LPTNQVDALADGADVEGSAGGADGATSFLMRPRISETSTTDARQRRQLAWALVQNDGFVETPPLFARRARWSKMVAVALRLRR
jgi:hypothetical protein